MSQSAAEFETLLRQALAPVEPPAELVLRLERALDEVEERLAGYADEASAALEDWNLDDMRDPRKWGRPAVAAVAGTAAGVALMVVRSRGGRQQRQSVGVRRFAERIARDLADEAKRVVDETGDR